MYSASGCRMLVLEECLGTGVFLVRLRSITWHSMGAVGKFIRTGFATTSSTGVLQATAGACQPRGQGFNIKALGILSQDRDPCPLWSWGLTFHLKLDC